MVFQTTERHRTLLCGNGLSFCREQVRQLFCDFREYTILLALVHFHEGLSTWNRFHGSVQGRK